MQYRILLLKNHNCQFLFRSKIIIKSPFRNPSCINHILYRRLQIPLFLKHLFSRLNNPLLLLLQKNTPPVLLLYP
ncbi:hypothetical protein LMOh7858_2744 [Listeria monocytogenes str. 4b H7858]|nr:hypothetical protein LMOh7858_2744 [Listeria monocytogenes str. 4b H7858] [Listeria monocytogenes serotype 4b str. H7858]